MQLVERGLGQRAVKLNYLTLPGCLQLQQMPRKIIVSLLSYFVGFEVV